MELRASSAPIWANCAGSTALEKVAEKENAESKEGDLCHLLSHHYSEGRLGTRMSADGINRLNGDLAKANNTGLLVTEEFRELALGASAYCLNLTDNGRGHCELRVRGGSLPDGVGGTTDFVGYQAAIKTLHIVDLKFGHGSVAAFENWQPLVYSIGVHDLFPKLEIEHIHLHIYQPRDYVNGAVKVWKLTFAQWATWKLLLQVRAAYAQEGKECITGPHCKHCLSKIFCPPFLSNTTSLLATTETNPESHYLTPDRLGRGYAYLKQAEVLIVAARKAFEDRILSDIEKGKPVQGWQLGRAAGKRRVSADLGTLQAVGAMLGLKLTVDKPVSVSALDKLSTASNRSALETLVTKSEGSQKLIPFDGGKAQEIFK